jgi:outer membrane protein OmpA-like peptidoglycan-associated protein
MKNALTKSLLLISLGLVSSSCTKPPYYDFESNHKAIKTATAGAAVGSIIGAASGNTLVGTAIGGATGALWGAYRESSSQLAKDLVRFDMQVVTYGDTTTVIVPTDKYFQLDTARLNDLCYPGLNTLARYIRETSDGPIYVAAFTDNVGSKKHKRLLTQAQAETMLTFLWAYHIPAQRLSAEGYSDKYDIANNQTIRGSAMNRRLEIQFHTHYEKPMRKLAFWKGKTK